MGKQPQTRVFVLAMMVPGKEWRVSDALWRSKPDSGDQITVRFVSSLEEAKRAHIEEGPAHVLLHHDEHHVGWQESLEAFSGLLEAPKLVVATRVGGERLWLEVLDQGGHDVVSEPFHPPELRRILTFSVQALSLAAQVA